MSQAILHGGKPNFSLIGSRFCPLVDIIPQDPGDPTRGSRDHTMGPNVFEGSVECYICYAISNDVFLIFKKLLLE